MPGDQEVMRPIHHVGYWVDDVDAGMAQFSSLLGIGPFQAMDHVVFAQFAMPGRDDAIVFDHAAAFAAWGPIVLELNAVHEIDAGLAELLRPVPGAVSHVSWLAPDLDAEVARLAEHGCTLINTAQTGPVSVAWVTGGHLLPHPIEVHLDTEFMRGMHGRLVALADGWNHADGTGLRRPMGPPPA